MCQGSLSHAIIRRLVILYPGSKPAAEVDPNGKGIIACIRCAICQLRIAEARRKCVREHPEWCETWETDDQMGDRVRRIAQCIEQYTRPGYLAYCVEVCLKCSDVKTPQRPR